MNDYVSDIPIPGTKWRVGYIINSDAPHTRDFGTYEEAESFRDWIHRKGGETYSPPIPLGE